MSNHGYPANHAKTPSFGEFAQDLAAQYRVHTTLPGLDEPQVLHDFNLSTDAKRIIPRLRLLPYIIYERRQAVDWFIAADTETAPKSIAELAHAMGALSLRTQPDVDGTGDKYEFYMLPDGIDLTLYKGWIKDNQPMTRVGIRSATNRAQPHYFVERHEQLLLDTQPIQVTQ